MPDAAESIIQESFDIPIPSWIRGRGNNCETCGSWARDKNCEYVGLCCSPVSLDHGSLTDSRYRCPSFVRRNGT